MLPALINKLVTVNRGGGYTLQSGVLPDSVTRVVEHYQSDDWRTGYRRLADGMLLQWAWGSFTTNPVSGQAASWSVNFPVPFTTLPIANCSFHGGNAPWSAGGIEALSPTNVNGFYLNSSPSQTSKTVMVMVIAVGK